MLATALRPMALLSWISLEGRLSTDLIGIASAMAHIACCSNGGRLIVLLVVALSMGFLTQLLVALTRYEMCPRRHLFDTHCLRNGHFEDGLARAVMFGVLLAGLYSRRTRLRWWLS